jgi:hypothetical protein
MAVLYSNRTSALGTFIPFDGSQFGDKKRARCKLDKVFAAHLVYETTRGRAMKRHYYLTTDLDDLKLVEQELERAGVSTPQFHVLSEDDAGVEKHQLHNVEAVLKKDVVHGTELGAIIGAIAAAAILVLAWMSGLTETYTWIPVIFLSVVVLGFCTWEGGLIGIQEPHADFKRFQEQLHEGKHVLFVDIPIEQESILQQVVHNHPKLQGAGEGSSTPGWIVGAQRTWTRFTQVAP